MCIHEHESVLDYSIELTEMAYYNCVKMRIKSFMYAIFAFAEAYDYSVGAFLYVSIDINERRH